MEREKEQGDETLSRDVLQASVILLFALLFFLCGGSYDRLRDGWGNTITINMFPLSIRCHDVGSSLVVGDKPIPRQSLSRLSGLCFRHPILYLKLWIGGRCGRLAHKRLIDLLSPLKTPLSTLTVGIATVYGMQRYHASVCIKTQRRRFESPRRSTEFFDHVDNNLQSPRRSDRYNLQSLR